MTWYVDIQMVDAYARQSSKRLEMTAADYATASVDAPAIVAAVQAVTELQVIAYTLSERTAYSGSLVANANRDEGATIKGRKADGYLATLKIPGPIVSMRNADGSIDVSNATLVTFLNMFLSGGALLISDGEVISTWISGVIDS